MRCVWASAYTLSTLYHHSNVQQRSVRPRATRMPMPVQVTVDYLCVCFDECAHVHFISTTSYLSVGGCRVTAVYTVVGSRSLERDDDGDGETSPRLPSLVQCSPPPLHLIKPFADVVSGVILIIFLPAYTSEAFNDIDLKTGYVH